MSFRRVFRLSSSDHSVCHFPRVANWRDWWTDFDIAWWHIYPCCGRFDMLGAVFDSFSQGTLDVAADWIYQNLVSAQQGCSLFDGYDFL